MAKDYKHVGFVVKRLSHVMSRYLENSVRAEGIDELTLMHGWVVRYLYENRGRDLFQKDLEKHFSVGRSTVTNVLQLMEKKGLVRRESVAHDARLKKVILTEKGIASHEKIEEIIAEMNCKMVEGLAEEDLNTFMDVIEHLRKNAEAGNITENPEKCAADISSGGEQGENTENQNSTAGKKEE